ncbi:MAG: SAM-dependent methyltransferase [Acidimicrobiales bacterium]
METALYHPVGGFYEVSAGPGRGGADFLTSPEIGPLFGSVLARALDRWWGEAGRPDPFFVLEAGAGPGSLAASILAARPSCSPALRYVLVERSASLRRRQSERLWIEPAGQVLGPVLAPDPDEAPGPVPGSGPLVASLAALPSGPFEGVVLANELLDNLPFRILERSARGWDEVRVGADLSEVLVAAPPEVAALAGRLAPAAEPGSRVPLQEQAAAWLAAALKCVREGRVVVIDYAGTTASMAGRPWREWLRTYRSHGPGGHPLEHLGGQDITSEVALDQLAAVRRPSGESTQADFLRAHGIDELATDARSRWQERAHVGDLAAVREASRVQEASALTDMDGLGAFRVVEWVVGLPG